MIVTGHIGPRIHDPGARTVQHVSDWRVQRMTSAELVRFVADVVDRRILLAQEVVPFDGVGCVFPALGVLHEISADARREIGTVYEYRDRANGTARNGQPSFPTVRFIHNEDWLRARDMIATEIVRRERLKS